MAGPHRPWKLIARREVSVGEAPRAISPPCPHERLEDVVHGDAQSESQSPLAQ